jgi:hypothetical protein
MKCSFRILSCVAVCWLLSCSPRINKSGNSVSESRGVGEPDYSDLYYWAAHPYKTDPSDSIPQPLKSTFSKDSTVDVFFRHPTTLTSKDDSSWNASLHDISINSKTDNSSILYQASAFNEYRVFAPRYRQAHIRSYYTAETAARIAFDVAYDDIKKAFQYYMAKENKGRPLIIASHSQGSTHAQRLLKEFFDTASAPRNLVAAYIPGMYIPSNLFTVLKPCTDATSTGCFVGWRTYRNGYVPDFVTKEKGTGVVVNPLTWKMNTTRADYTLNKGAVTLNFNQVRKGVSDAQIHNGILWINRPHIPGSLFLKMKNFHVGDINLFYMNIRENLRDRVVAFRAGSLSDKL